MEKVENQIKSLITEAAQIQKTVKKTVKKYGATIDICDVDEKLSKKIARKKGRYMTVTSSDDDSVQALCYALKCFVKKGRILVAGMGNGRIIADALGDKVVDYLKKYGLEDTKISVFAPSVGAVTNINSVEMVKAVARWHDPDCVIAVDALSTSHYERLGKCYQITDSELLPGGGTGGGVGNLDEKTLGTKFVAIGVPFILSTTDNSVNGRHTLRYMLPYDIDSRVDVCAQNIARALYDCYR